MADINDRLDRLQRRLEFDRLSADPDWTPHPPGAGADPAAVAIPRPAGVDDRLGEVLDAVAAVVAKHPGLSVMVAVADGRTGRPVVRVTERDGSVETGVVVSGPGAGTAPVPAAQVAAVPTMAPARGPVIPGEAVLSERSSADVFGRRPAAGDAGPDSGPDVPVRSDAGGGSGAPAAGVRGEESAWDVHADRSAGGIGHGQPAIGAGPDRSAGDARGETPTGPAGRYGDGVGYERAAGGIRYDVPTEGRDGVRLDRAGDNAGYDRTLAGQRPGAAGFLFEDRTGGTEPAPPPGPASAEDGPVQGRPEAARSASGWAGGTHPEAAYPPADRPGARGPVDGRPGSDRLDGGGPERDRIEAGGFGGGRSEDGGPERGRIDGGGFGSGGFGSGRPGTGQFDGGGSERRRSEAGGSEPGGSEPGGSGVDRSDSRGPGVDRSDAGRHAAQDDRGVGAGWSGTSWHHALWSRPADPDPRPAERATPESDPGPGPERSRSAQEEVPAPPGGTLPLAEDTSEVVARLAQLLRENPTLTTSWSREVPE